jgi:alpha-glucuronidase
MAAEDDVRDRVQHYLTKHFRVGLEKGGGFSVDHESTRGFVFVHGQGDRVVVQVEAVVAFNVPESREMLEHVATQSDAYLFGHLAIRPSRNKEQVYMALFVHSLLGDYLDEEELMNAVVAVVGTANRIDNDFVARFGGETFHDT